MTETIKGLNVLSEASDAAEQQTIADESPAETTTPEPAAEEEGTGPEPIPEPTQRQDVRTADPPIPPTAAPEQQATTCEVGIPTPTAEDAGKGVNDFTDACDAILCGGDPFRAAKQRINRISE